MRCGVLRKSAPKGGCHAMNRAWTLAVDAGAGSRNAAEPPTASQAASGASSMSGWYTFRCLHLPLFAPIAWLRFGAWSRVPY